MQQMAFWNYMLAFLTICPISSLPFLHREDSISRVKKTLSITEVNPSITASLITSYEHILYSEENVCCSFFAFAFRRCSTDNDAGWIVFNSIMIADNIRYCKTYTNWKKVQWSRHKIGKWYKANEESGWWARLVTKKKILKDNYY